MKRIRYENSKKEGILCSVRNIRSSTTNAMYVVYLNTIDCTYEIKSLLGKRSYHGGENITSIVVLKRKIKEHLTDLGVNFGAEIRNVGGNSEI